MSDQKSQNKLKNQELEQSTDPLKQSYLQSQLYHPERSRALREHRAALLCIDLQYLDAAPGHGVFSESYPSSPDAESQEYYFRTLKEQVLPNVNRLQACFRRYGLEVIHVRIQSLTQDGRDRSEGHKRLNLHAAPGSKEAEFLEEVAPQGDEIIINKTSSGPFNTTNINYILKNLGVEFLYMVGVYTNECVSTTARDASDHGYFVTLVADGCATVTQELHENTIKVLKDRYARVMTTGEVEKVLKSHVNS